MKCRCLSSSMPDSSSDWRSWRPALASNVCSSTSAISSMRGAMDNIPAIRQIINELGIREHYIHADAALSGMILPYVDDPQSFGFDAGIDSISISGHKLTGFLFVLKAGARPSGPVSRPIRACYNARA